MKRILKITGAVLAALLSVALLTVIAGYVWSFRLAGGNCPGRAELAAVEILPGDPVTGTLSFELPLHWRVRDVEIRPGGGSVAAGSPEIRWSAWRFDRMRYRVSFELRPFRDGEIPEGELTVVFAGKGQEPAIVKIPAFQVKAPEKTAGIAEIALAAPAGTEQSWLHRLWIPVVLLCLILLLCILLRRRRGRQVMEPPWTRALAALAQLRSSLTERRLPLEAGFARLTDLVRKYLEERFAIPVSSRTTPEFLYELDAADSPLPEKERPFLREFLLIADQVKFAKMTPDEAVLQQAIRSAETLVSETTPTEKEGKE